MCVSATMFFTSPGCSGYSPHAPSVGYPPDAGTTGPLQNPCLVTPRRGDILPRSPSPRTRSICHPCTTSSHGKILFPERDRRGNKFHIIAGGGKYTWRKMTTGQNFTHESAQAVLPQLAVQGAFPDAQQLGGLFAIAARQLQRFPDGAFFQLLQSDPGQ